MGRIQPFSGLDSGGGAGEHCARRAGRQVPVTVLSVLFPARVDKVDC